MKVHEPRKAADLPSMQSGAVLMEYVVLGVLVAAAVVIAVCLFGKTIQANFPVPEP